MRELILLKLLCVLYILLKHIYKRYLLNVVIIIISWNTYKLQNYKWKIYITSQVQIKNISSYVHDKYI